MLLQLKLRLGALLIVVGALIAMLGEIVNLWNNNPLAGGWFVSMILVALGTVVLVYGINQYAQLSDSIDFFGLIGAGLLFLGGLLTIIGVIAVNMLAIPMLLSMATAIAAVVNAPGSAAQSATNGISSGLNTLKNGAAGLFGQSGGSDIPSVNVPSVNGLDIVNKVLTGLHLPTFAGISWWGHVFFSGGPLTIGCLLLGFAMLRTNALPRITCLLLMAVAGVNLISQFFTTLAPTVATITGILLFATLAWLGASILFPQATSKLAQSLPLLSKEPLAQESVSTESNE
jgi:hypothetical protein